MSNRSSSTQIQRVQTDISPNFKAFYGHHPVTVICDSGATSSLIKHSFAVTNHIPISQTMHSASQADGKTKLHHVVKYILPYHVVH